MVQEFRIILDYIFDYSHISTCIYGVALVSRIDKITALFCKRDPEKRRYSAKGSYNFIDPTDRSHCILPYRKRKRHITAPDTATQFFLLYRSECIYSYVNALHFLFLDRASKRQIILPNSTRILLDHIFDPVIERLWVAHLQFRPVYAHTYAY